MEVAKFMIHHITWLSGAVFSEDVSVNDFVSLRMSLSHRPSYGGAGTTASPPHSKSGGRIRTHREHESSASSSAALALAIQRVCLVLCVPDE
jgi:hypothetical protein